MFGRTAAYRAISLSAIATCTALITKDAKSFETARAERGKLDKKLAPADLLDLSFIGEEAAGRSAAPL